MSLLAIVSRQLGIRPFVGGSDTGRYAPGNVESWTRGVCCQCRWKKNRRGALANAMTLVRWGAQGPRSSVLQAAQFGVFVPTVRVDVRGEREGKTKETGVKKTGVFYVSTDTKCHAMMCRE